MSKRKNEKKSIKERWSKIELSDKINIVLAVISFVSLVLVGVTVHEMIVDRKSAYRPTILINPIELEFSWDANGKEEWVVSSKVESSQSYDENGALTGTVSVPMTILPNDGLEKFSAVNVGVGIAKEVVFEWGTKNAQDLNDFLVQCDSTKKDFFQMKESASFSYEEGLVITDIPNNTRLMYMLADAEETYSMYLPSVYSLLIHETIKTNNHNNKFPPLLLSASFYDIQGNKYTEVFLIQIQKTFYEEDETGAGKARYRLVPAISQE